MRVILRLCMLSVLMTLGYGMSVSAALIYASGQFLVENEPGTHDDVRQNFVYAINPATGQATPVSPVLSGGTPAGLAGTPDGRLLGFNAGQLGAVQASSGTFTPIGAPSGVSATGFDILTDGNGFLLPFNAAFDTQQLHRIDLITGAVSPLGSATAVGDAVDAARGTAPGTATPFIISLGSVGNDLYGVDLDTASLIRLDPVSGAASVVGTPGAVQADARASFSGFAALSGVDMDGNGAFDSLFGAVNFRSTAQGTERFGGVVQFDLDTGEWTLIGDNPGVIFFGFGSSPVPEPASLALCATGLAGLYAWKRRRCTGA